MFLTQHKQRFSGGLTRSGGWYMVGIFIDNLGCMYAHILPGCRRLIDVGARRVFRLICDIDNTLRYIEHLHGATNGIAHLAFARLLPTNMAPAFGGLSGRKLGVTISSVATMGFLLFGYDQGVMSGIISDKHFNNVFTATKGNSVMQATVTAVYEVGCLVGAMFSLFTADWMGRRYMILAGATIMIIGVIIQVTAFVDHIPLLQFIFGRVITGIGNGMNTSTIPTYQAECSKTSNRGLLICIEGGVIAIGTLIAYWIDFGAHFGPSDLVWRFPIAFQIVFGIVILVGMSFLPDSPRYLISRDRMQDGEYVLAALNGCEIEDETTQLQKQMVLDSIRA